MHACSQYVCMLTRSTFDGDIKWVEEDNLSEDDRGTDKQNQKIQQSRAGQSL